MRLLQISGQHDDGSYRLDFNLVQYYSDIPPYAILSHTLLPEDQEVNFQDMVNKTGKNKPGMKKLRFCALRALLDGISYIWVSAANSPYYGP